jgi:hypothetical protein
LADPGVPKTFSANDPSPQSIQTRRRDGDVILGGGERVALAVVLGKYARSVRTQSAAGKLSKDAVRPAAGL